MGFEELLGVNPWTAGFTLLNTVALFLVMKKYLWVPIMKMIEDRQKEIDDMYDDAEQDKSQANALRVAYEQKLEEAAQTGERMVKDAMHRGQQRSEEILRQANAEAEAILRKAEADIQREKKKAVEDAKNEIAGLAVDIAEKVVEQNMDGKDHAALVDQFIDRLGEGL